MEDVNRIEAIKNILFDKDLEYIEDLAKRIHLLEETLNNEKELTKKIDPLVANQLLEFTEKIPTNLGPTITATLKEQIKNQKDDVVDAIFPILGKMIKKYVAQEIRLVTEKIDDQFNFVSRWKIKMKALFSSKKQKELLLQQLVLPTVEQVLLIEKDSGILKASYAKAKSIDEEMVSGMLTAIKSFVEDAFEKKGQSLELIEYELYQIVIQSFVTHYIAVVVSGPFGVNSKNKLQDLIFDFYNRFMAMNVDLVVDFPTLAKNTKKVTKATIEKELQNSFRDAKI